MAETKEQMRLRLIIDYTVELEYLLDQRDKSIQQVPTRTYDFLAKYDTEWVMIDTVISDIDAILKGLHEDSIDPKTVDY